VAALGPGKGNFGANCGEPGATRLVGLRARRWTVVPDGRECQGMEWETATVSGGLASPRKGVFKVVFRTADFGRFQTSN